MAAATARRYPQPQALTSSKTSCSRNLGTHPAPVIRIDPCPILPLDGSLVARKAETDAVSFSDPPSLPLIDETLLRVWTLASIEMEDGSVLEPDTTYTVTFTQERVAPEDREFVERALSLNVHDGRNHCGGGYELSETGSLYQHRLMHADCLYSPSVSGNPFRRSFK